MKNALLDKNNQQRMRISAAIKVVGIAINSLFFFVNICMPIKLNNERGAKTREMRQHLPVVLQRFVVLYFVILYFPLILDFASESGDAIQ